MTTSFKSARRGGAGASCTGALVAAAAIGMSIGVAQAQQAQQARLAAPAAPLEGRSAVSLAVGVDRPEILAVTRHGLTTPVVTPFVVDCSRESKHTNWDFQSAGQFNAQGGFAEQEIAAATYVLTAADFPLKLSTAEILFATQNTTVTTTTQWSVLVWQGTPNNGTLVTSESSDGTILPHLVMAAGTNGTIVQFSVDPQDPEQIVIQDNGSHSFTIGFRIDKHNNQTQNPCFFGPPAARNAFPTTDFQSLKKPANNWLYGLNCGSLGCPPNGGWSTFQSLSQLCRPTGDWVMRATWQPVSCTPGVGACCLADGTCQVNLASLCVSSGGTYKGDGSTCATANCPLPSGACCFSNGSCLTRTQADCTALAGTWQGAGTACNGTACPTGACCFADGTCTVVTPLACTGQGGVYRGTGVSCATAACPQPTGACCLSGDLCGTLSQSDCTLIGGTWKGAGSACDTCAAPACYANCDGSTTVPFLNVADFNCFLSKFAGGCATPTNCYANCDGSTQTPFLNVADFNCFLSKFAGGCANP